MKYSEFEKHISEELNNATEPVHMESLLDGLNLGPQKKRRRFGPYFIWVLLPCVFLASGLSFFAFDAESSSTPQFVYEDNSKSNDYENNDDGYFSDQSHDEENSRLIINSRSAELTEAQKNKAQQNSFENNNEFSSGVNDENTLTNITKDNSKIEFKDIHSRHYEKRPNPVLPNANKGFFSNFEAQKSQASIDTKNNSNTEEKYGNEMTEKSFYKLPVNNNITSKKIETPAFLDRKIDPVASLNQEIDGAFSRMKINCPSFNQAFWRIALVPEVGVFSPFKTLDSKSSEQSFAYNQRKENEVSLEGLNIGLYGMIVRDRLPVYIKAGVSYSRITERLDQNYSDTSYVTEVGIVSSTVSANGDTITHIYGDVVSEVVEDVNTRQHNYIHLFDMPVSVGYNAYLLGFDVGIEAGVKLNFMTRATGNLLVGNNEYVNLVFNRYFKPKIDISYFGGLMIGRNFKGLGDFYLAPRFTYYPSDFTNEINQVSQKYVAVGLNAGFIYKIK